MATGERLRHAEPVMGTVFSFDVPAAAAPVLPAVLRWLHWVDATFSTYREDSDASRFGRGAAGLADCAPELAEVIAQCAVLSELSGGYFTDRPAGRFDPSGFVKGWSVEHAAAMLTAVGQPSVSVNGAGDVQCAGEPEPGRRERVVWSEYFQRWGDLRAGDPVTPEEKERILQKINTSRFGPFVDWSVQLPESPPSTE